MHTKKNLDTSLIVLGQAGNSGRRHWRVEMVQHVSYQVRSQVRILYIDEMRAMRGNRLYLQLTWLKSIEYREW